MNFKAGGENKLWEPQLFFEKNQYFIEYSYIYLQVTVFFPYLNDNPRNNAVRILYTKNSKYTFQI